MTWVLPSAILALGALIAGGASALASSGAGGASALASSGASALAGSRSSGVSATPAASGFTNRVFANGAKIFHKTPKGKEAVTLPDDLTYLQGHIFVGFQSGVGPQGEASTTGNKDSTIVEFTLRGRPIRQWDVVGKCDGLTADPAVGLLIATVNEDAHSSAYLIDPVAGGKAVHYRYDKPLPSKGGTDAISIYHGMVLISASAPGTTGAPAPSPKYPAVYHVVFSTKTHVATIHPLFSDEALTTVANTNGATHGKRVHLALTDPDSTGVVPAYAHRFAGDFMLTSQGDDEQIYVSNGGSAHQTLSVLKLSDSVDDTAWPSGGSGALYTTTGSADTIDKISGPFKRGSVFVAATPCNANNAPTTCPAPGFTGNYLGELNSNTGAVTRVALSGPAVSPHGMIFAP